MPVASHDQNKLMAVLAYLGPLVIVSYIVAKNSPFIKFHIKQGLVLLAIEVIMWGLGSTMMFYSIWMIFNLVNLAVLVLSIIGIVNAVNGKEQALPVVGKFAKHFPV